MINVFIIHSGSDETFVRETMEPILLKPIGSNGGGGFETNACNVLTLSSGEPGSWKKDALNKIKMAHVVIVVIGEDSHKESKKETMGWEVSKALKYNKAIMLYPMKNEYILDENGKLNLPEYLKTKDRFSAQEVPVADIMTMEEIRQKIDDYTKGNYDIFSSAYVNLNSEAKTARKNELIDQYKMFQKTSEDLVARRQSVNSFYITVNSALTALLGVALGVFDSSVKSIIVGFMCIAGLILDVSWLNILEAYGTLNAAKMKVIRLLEEQLPISLYDAEWRIMSDKLNNKKYVSFTDSEKRVPKLFFAIYSLMLIWIIVFYIYSLITT